MTFTTIPETSPKKSRRDQLAKSAILLVVSIGLLIFAEMFSPISLFEPQSVGWKLWFSYAKDLILPFALYLLLCLGDRWLRTWRSRAAIAFAIPTILEFGQLLYYRVSAGLYVGSFDVLDIVMYAIGVGLAVLIEQRFLQKILRSS